MIKRIKFKHDLICIILYFLITTIAGMIYCSYVTEGYIYMIAVFINAFLTTAISVILILLIKKISNKYKTLELLLGLIPLIIFEMIYIVIGEPLLFGVFGFIIGTYEGSELAMSLSSLTSVVLIYGMSIWIKTKHNNVHVKYT